MGHGDAQGVYRTCNAEIRGEHYPYGPPLLNIRQEGGKYMEDENQTPTFSFSYPRPYMDDVAHYSNIITDYWLDVIFDRKLNYSIIWNDICLCLIQMIQEGDLKGDFYLTRIQEAEKMLGCNILTSQVLKYGKKLAKKWAGYRLAYHKAEDEAWQKWISAVK